MSLDENFYVEDPGSGENLLQIQELSSDSDVDEVHVQTEAYQIMVTYLHLPTSLKVQITIFYLLYFVSVCRYFVK